MGETPNDRQFQPATRILLICPDCGHENSELAETLRGKSTYYCSGDGCDYLFDLSGSRQYAGRGFAEACRRFYAAFYGWRGQGAR